MFSLFFLLQKCFFCSFTKYWANYWLCQIYYTLFFNLKYSFFPYFDFGKDSNFQSINFTLKYLLFYKTSRIEIMNLQSLGYLLKSINYKKILNTAISNFNNIWGYSYALWHIHSVAQQNGNFPSCEIPLQVFFSNIFRSSNWLLTWHIPFFNPTSMLSLLRQQRMRGIFSAVC